MSDKYRDFELTSPRPEKKRDHSIEIKRSESHPSHTELKQSLITPLIERLSQIVEKDLSQGTKTPQARSAEQEYIRPSQTIFKAKGNLLKSKVAKAHQSPTLNAPPNQPGNSNATVAGTRLSSPSKSEALRRERDRERTKKMHEDSRTATSPPYRPIDQNPSFKVLSKRLQNEFTDMPDEVARSQIEVKSELSFRDRDMQVEVPESNWSEISSLQFHTPSGRTSEFKSKSRPKLTDNQLKKQKKTYISNKARLSNVIDLEPHVSKKIKISEDEIFQIPSASGKNGKEKKKEMKILSKKPSPIEEETEGREGVPLRKRGAYQVMFTGMEKSAELNKVKRDLVIYGARIVEECDKPFNILVMDEFRRTVNFLIGLNRGVDVVNIRWVYDSIMHRKLLPIEKYIYRDVEAERDFNFSLAESLQTARKTVKSFLFGFKVWISEKILPSYEEIKQLVISADGTVIKSKPKHKDQETSEIIIIAMSDDHATVGHWVNLGYRVYRTELLYDASLYQSLELDLDDYLLGEP